MKSSYLIEDDLNKTFFKTLTSNLISSSSSWNSYSFEKKRDQQYSNTDFSDIHNFNGSQLTSFRVTTL